jgi:ABC-2 type transport system ATP-binding protein
VSDAGYAIECSGLSKDFGGRKALGALNLQAPPGTVMALVGSNGAGKTTLMKILATLLVPSRGAARVLGCDVAVDPFWVKSRIGFVSSEERSFSWRLSCRQNLDFFGALHGLAKEVRTRRMEALFQAVGLEGIADLPVQECSSGMKQVLGLLRGLLHDPPVLLLDEPTRSLAPDVALRVRRMIRREVESHGKTVLIASHNLSEVESMADRIAILHRGEILAAGTLAALAEQAGQARQGNLEALFQHFVHERADPS